jgi:agmatine deiminase
MAVAEGATILKTKIIHEGGAIEVNGKGTLIFAFALPIWIYQTCPTNKGMYKS